VNSQSPVWLRSAPAFLRTRIEGRTNLLAVIHNTGWLFADKAMRTLLGLLVGAWVARYLGPELYGEFAYVLAFVAFFAVLGPLGLSAVAIRDMARDTSASAMILGTVMRLRLVAGFLAWGAAIGGMALLRPGDTQALILTAIVGGTVVFQASDTIDLWFQSQMQSKRTVSAKAAAYLVANALKVVLILTKASLVAFAAVTLVEAILSAVALWFASRRFPAPGAYAWRSDWVGGLLRESWPYLLAGLAIVIYMRIDQIMLRDMISAHELGIFSAALPISTAGYFIPMAIAMSVAPTIARRKQNDPQGYAQAHLQLYTMMWWVMLPLSAGIALASGPLIALLYGPAYSGSARVLAIHVFANVPVALGVAQSIWIVNEGRNTISLYQTATGAAANILLNLILIPLYGAVGAAVATLISQSVSAIFSNVIFAPEILRMQFSSILGTRTIPVSD
jgi:O-antigen/teichoic acid export membrane protein